MRIKVITDQIKKGAKSGSVINAGSFSNIRRVGSGRFGLFLIGIK